MENYSLLTAQSLLICGKAVKMFGKQELGKYLPQRKKVNRLAKRTNVMVKWKEFNPLSKRSMREDFCNSPSPYAEKIVAYLDNGELVLASPSNATDIFSGEKLNQTSCILTDGEYSWSNSLSYYVQKYNLRIPKELEEKIVNM